MERTSFPSHRPRERIFLGLQLAMSYLYAIFIPWFIVALAFAFS